THETFRTFVTKEELEFFDIGGNPQDLMSYMVKNPGLIPGVDSLTNGDIPRKRRMLAEMMNGCWLSCHSRCPQTGKNFTADAIIANPPSFAHIHCAEALGIPLLLSFTMPWSATSAFPHPLVNVKDSNARRGLTNYLTYPLAELLTWQGMGDIINKLRTRTLGLAPLSARSGPAALDTCKVPWTYCMSPALVPKPKDWKNHIDVVGFYFLDLATNYTPPDDLAAFLASGDAPIYIGFGSVVVDDPVAMTSTIFEATKQAGVRALVSAGWVHPIPIFNLCHALTLGDFQGGLGGVSIPSHIFILGNIPHDWLFSNGRVAAVVHHGGAGTTAAGLSKGLPTVVVPFFGDQGFWGNMIHKAGAGPAPIPPKSLTVDSLKDAIGFLVSPAAKNTI
ncbi:UDP-Glycosyltransferase/glycogen phosphorylase, partial [Guyanagaster necrorhizus]